MFGRDSIFTSLQRCLSALSWRRRPSRRSPSGKVHSATIFATKTRGILHEMRFGEMTLSRSGRTRPTTAAPTTPLTSCCSTSTSAGRATSREYALESTRGGARLIDTYADLQGNGYVSYQRRNEKTASRTSAGRTPGTRSPTATAGCRVPRRPASCKATPTTPSCARPAAASLEDPPTPTVSKSRPRPETPLQSRLLGRDGHTSAALDADGGRSTRCLHNGHLLWSGIVDKNKAKRSSAPDGSRLYSGWGVRTSPSEGLQPMATRRHHLAYDTRSSPGAAPLRLSRRSGAHRGGSSMRPSSSKAAAEAFGGTRSSPSTGAVPHGLQPQAWSTGAALLLAPCSASSRSATTWSSTPPAQGIGHSSCSTSRALGPHRRLRRGMSTSPDGRARKQLGVLPSQVTPTPAREHRH